MIMTCPKCGAFDWKEFPNGSLCDICFTFILKKIPPCDIDDLPDEEFHGQIENPWYD